MLYTKNVSLEDALDYTLGPGEIDRLNLVRVVNTRFPDCRILMMSSSDTPATAQMTMPAGAPGFFGKREDPGKLTHAVRVVAEGFPCFSAELAAQMDSSATPNPRVTNTKVANRDAALISRRRVGVRHRVQVLPQPADD
ncbi:response regulator [Burkholderia cepacia]|uniref:hypothetical protein n=1 Tax=Burkholderia cepacia TaxID=292 RepID=UPI002AB656D7|nr:hypothetical protein [Burkholderia cepacia]